MAQVLRRHCGCRLLISSLYACATCLALLLLAVAGAAAAMPGPAHTAPTGRAAAWQGGTLLAGLTDPTLLRVQPGGGRIIAADAAVEAILRRWDLTQATELGAGSGIYRLAGPADFDVPEAAADLAAVAGVSYAEPDYRVSANLIPNDPEFAANQPDMRQVHAPEAWDITTGSRNIVLASLDTGVASDHPDLAGKVLPGWDFVNGDADAYDDNGHGTYTAGLMAADSNNGFGVAGVCWGCRILPVKILDAAGQGAISDFALGIRWATDHGAQVLNISAGIDTASRTMAAAVQYATAHNVVIVASAGNTPDGLPRWPAGYDQVIAVSAVDGNDQEADFASFGSFVDLVAPGVDVLGPTVEYGRPGYAWASGTSSSAPFVSGAAGLLLSVNPKLTVAQVRDALQGGADDLGPPG